MSIWKKIFGSKEEPQSACAGCAGGHKDKGETQERPSMDIIITTYDGETIKANISTLPGRSFEDIFRDMMWHGINLSPIGRNMVVRVNKIEWDDEKAKEEPKDEKEEVVN